MQQEITGILPAQQLQDKTIETSFSMPSTIKLNFVNESNDVNNSEIVIFQKNIMPWANELAFAWKVIRNCGTGWNHPFEFALQTEVAVSDAFGNFSQRIDASPGNIFEVVRDRSGNQLKLDGQSANPEPIEVRNHLDMGTVNAFVYRSGTVAAAKTNIAPGQVALFAFRPTIYIGVASQVTEGEVVSASVVSRINTEISLLGIGSADIVMTGGGSGPTATPYQFSLQNVNMI